MIRLSRFTLEELRDFDKQSTENMMVYYEKEMRLINEGKMASKLMTRPLINRFVESGILELGRQARGTRILLSRRAKEFYGLS